MSGTASVECMEEDHHSRPATARTRELGGRTVVVLDDAELPDDLARDLTEVLTSMCARLYSRRSAARRAASAVTAIENEPDESPGDPS